MVRGALIPKKGVRWGVFYSYLEAAAEQAPAPAQPQVLGVLRWGPCQNRGSGWQADGPAGDGEPRTPQSHRLKCPRRGDTSCPLQEHHLEKVPPPVPPHMPLLATAATSLLHRGAVDLEVGPFTP